MEQIILAIVVIVMTLIVSAMYRSNKKDSTSKSVNTKGGGVGNSDIENTPKDNADEKPHKLKEKINR